MKCRSIQQAAPIIALMLSACAGPSLGPESPSHPASAQAAESRLEVDSPLATDETSRAVNARLQQTADASAGIDNIHVGHDTKPAAEPAEKSNPKAGTYTCPMHPEIQQNQSRDCPVCGMTLIEK